jgi:hypothetical protein
MYITIIEKLRLYHEERDSCKSSYKKSRKFKDTDEEGNMEDSMPFDQCPKCGSKNLSKFDELRDGMGSEGMTDGELAEYEAGNWGTVTCLDCGHTVDFD